MVTICNTFSNRNELKVGVFSMRNYFLYFKSDDNNSFNSHKLEDVFYFSACKLLAMDVQKYNNKNIRFGLQQKLGIRPYYITQSIFKEFLFYALNNNNLILMDIRFKDPEAESCFMYNQILNQISQRYYDSIYNSILEIMDTYDTDISSIVLRFNGYDFNISSEGILDTDSPMGIFNDFINDPIINRLIMGLY